MTFLHLHCHSDRTIGKSLIKPPKLAEYYSVNDVKGACITDNGNISGAILLYNACKVHKIKPVIGIEVNVVQNRTMKTPGSSTLVLLAKNLTGFYNIVKIATTGSMYFYYVPRVDEETIFKYAEGVICLTSDMKGLLASKFFIGGQAGIQEAHEKYKAVFHDDLYWELQPTQVDAQRVYNTALLKAAKEIQGMKLVATGDPHYLRREDGELHRTLLAAKNARNPVYVYPFQGDYHVMSEVELIEAFCNLHGVGIMQDQDFFSAIERHNHILETIESFELRQGTRVPTYVQ